MQKIPSPHELHFESEKDLTKSLEKWLSEKLRVKRVPAGEDSITMFIPYRLRSVGSYTVVLLKAAGYTDVEFHEGNTEDLGFCRQKLVINNLKPR